MLAFISTYGIVPVFLILVIGIPAIVNFIKWCKGLWKEREGFKQENIAKGRAIEKSVEAKEERFQSGESRMSNLETEYDELKQILLRQQDLIDLLIQSDELDIKSWIKIQHEKWMPRKCIDSQTLDLLEQRYAIYTREGGNSWAEKLMTELRSLPTVTAISISEFNKH